MFRAKPVWTIIDVYAGAPELDAAAEDVRRTLGETLDGDRRLFNSVAVALGGTQEESLLWLMGLSQAQGRLLQPRERLFR